MKILGVDELPEEWRGQLNSTGLLRYRLFAEELSRTSIISAVSSRGIIDILTGIRGEDFPYNNIQICKPSTPHWKKLNRSGHMAVCIQNNRGVIQLLEGTLDHRLMQSHWNDTNFLNITL